MLALGIGVAWFGYALLFWGVAFISGKTLGFLTVIWPTRWAKRHASTAKPKAK